MGVCKNRGPRRLQSSRNVLIRIEGKGVFWRSLQDSEFFFKRCLNFVLLQIWFSLGAIRAIHSGPPQPSKSTVSWSLKLQLVAPFLKYRFRV